MARRRRSEHQPPLMGGMSAGGFPARGGLDFDFGSWSNGCAHFVRIPEYGIMAEVKGIVLSDEEKAVVREALELKQKSLLRAAATHQKGSQLEMAFQNSAGFIAGFIQRFM